MPINPFYLQDFQPGISYHIYNRTNNNEQLFIDDDERNFFLAKMDEYLSGYFDIHVYCLLDNHFHLVATPKSIKKIDTFLRQKNTFELCKTELIYLHNDENHFSYPLLLTNQFKRLFISYSISINNDRKRNGNLFQRQFKRIKIEDLIYFRNLVIYIHQNPAKHGMNQKYETYPWSSYLDYAKSKHSSLSRKKIYTLFEGKQKLIEAHKTFKDYTEFQKMVLIERNED